MNTTKAKQLTRKRRHTRIRARVEGTPARPRLSVYRSNRYLHAQLIDDEAGATIASGSTREMAKKKKADAAVWLGEEIAKRAKAAGVSRAVFDRGGFRYIGRIAAFAEAARKGGLEF